MKEGTQCIEGDGRVEESGGDVTKEIITNRLKVHSSSAPSPSVTLVLIKTGSKMQPSIMDIN